MSGRSSKLDGVHPMLVAKVLAIHAEMLRMQGHVMLVTDGVRTAKEQMLLYAQGRTSPGPIVTHCDGVIRKSNHQLHADGLGHALDCCFIVDGRASWDALLPWHVFGVLVTAQGLTWGGSWPHPKTDRPHVELPDLGPTNPMELA